MIKWLKKRWIHIWGVYVSKTHCGVSHSVLHKPGTKVTLRCSVCEKILYSTKRKIVEKTIEASGNKI